MIQLQDSNKELKNENVDLRSQTQHLRNEARDREKFWRALWQARSTGMPPDPTDDAALPSYAQLHHSSPMHTPSRLASVSPTTVGHYQDPRLHYTADPSASMAPQQYHGATATEFMQRSPALGFAPADSAVAGPSRAQSVDPQRIPNYTTYTSYATEGSSPEENWPQHGLPNSVGDRNNMDGSPSPTYVESPSLTSSELAYTSHSTAGDDQKISLNGVNQSPYMYTASRSTSPASTPTSTSSMSLAAAPYQFTFPEGSPIQDRPEFAAHRRSNPYFNLRTPGLTLHGGTADIPIAGTVGDAMRYRMTPRANTMPTGVLPPYSHIDQTPQDRESDEDDSQPGARSRPRRSTVPGALPSRSSQSPSPPPPISGTLAVIKAQAFGALRRTRGRNRRSSEGAAKLSVEALSARGIAVGPAPKRQKLRNESSNDALV